MSTERVKSPKTGGGTQLSLFLLSAGMVCFLVALCLMTFEQDFLAAVGVPKSWLPSLAKTSRYSKHQGNKGIAKKQGAIKQVPKQVRKGQGRPAMHQGKSLTDQTVFEKASSGIVVLHGGGKREGHGGETGSDGSSRTAGIESKGGAAQLMVKIEVFSEGEGMPPVNINDKQVKPGELLLLPGVGMAEAAAILSQQQKAENQNLGAAFDRMEDLLAIGFPPGLVHQLSPFVTLGSSEAEVTEVGFDDEQPNVAPGSMLMQQKKYAVRTEQDPEKDQWVLDMHFPGAASIALVFSRFDVGLDQPVALYSLEEGDEVLAARYAGALGGFRTRPVKGPKLRLRWQRQSEKDYFEITSLVGFLPNTSKDPTP